MPCRHGMRLTIIVEDPEHANVVGGTCRNMSRREALLWQRQPASCSTPVPRAQWCGFSNHEVDTASRCSCNDTAAALSANTDRASQLELWIVLLFLIVGEFGAGLVRAGIEAKTHEGSES